MRNLLKIFLMSLVCFTNLFAESRIANANEMLDMQRKKGVQEATALLEKGRFVLMLYSSPAPVGLTQKKLDEYAKFGIEIRNIGDALVDERQAFLSGFNSVMEKAIVKKHGLDVFKTIQKRIYESPSPAPSNR
jgi:hypothetical protein